MNEAVFRIQSCLRQTPWGFLDPVQGAQWCQAEGVKILWPENFPPLLRQITPVPRWLFCRGDATVLSSGVCVAMVGTRRPSTYGMRAAVTLALALARAGYVLVSGLARGIDTAVHESALKVGVPTVAVLGHGLNQVYPAQNRGLARQIVDAGGCLLSEYPPGVGPRPHHFPERNRVISGLTLATIVVEAGDRSGSLITARHALEQNREVFVVPGPFDESGFSGSHTLLKQGACLLTHSNQVSEELGIAQKEIPDSDGQSGPLRQWIKLRGVATLGELMQAAQAVGADWLHELSLGQEQGWVVELQPQTYAYVAADYKTT